ncbi:MAG TPA: hypothetical protein VD995_29940 [Azospirillum sp.]|nr:hypothetical protein [Azospirillum sp.]
MTHMSSTVRNADARRALDRAWVIAAVYALFAGAGMALLAEVVPLTVHPQRLLTPSGIASFVAFCALSLSAVLAPALLAPESSRALARALARAIEARTGLFIALAVAAALAGSLVVAVVVLEAFPNSGDEYAYLFQAWHFARGELWVAAPPLGETFAPYRTWVLDGKWVSQYPPGWPGALALAVLVGLPVWAANALFGGALAASLAARAWPYGERTVALAVALVFALTPFTVYNAASYHSHVFTALCIALLCVACVRHGEGKGGLALVAAALCLGVIGATRYMTLLLLIPAMLVWVFVENRRAWLRIAVVMALVAAPFLVLLMLYQDAVTGSPFRSTYSVINRPDIFLTAAWEDVVHGSAISLYRVAELAVWASPILLALYLVAFAVKVRNGALRFYDLIFPTFLVGYVFFPTLGGNRYGPRYYYEAFPLMLATIGTAAPLAAARGRRVWERPVVLHAVLVCVATLALTHLFLWPTYRAQIAERQDLYRLAADMGLDKAIVIVKTTPGLGLIAEDLARNGLSVDGPVLYARPDAAPEDLRKAFPDRSVWVYERGSPDEPGRLTPATP